MAYFFGGALSTPVGQQIARATDNAASAGDLQLHLDICDTINETDSGPKDAIAALRKRITSNLKNFHVINLSLTVLETASKNCGIRFHIRVAQKDFLQDLLKVISAKNNPPTIVKERVLGLIQQWADAFRANPQLSAVVELYNQLKQDGVEFPAQDLDNMAPINTPDRPKSDTSATARSNPSELQLTQASSQLPAAQGTPPARHVSSGRSALSGTQQAKLLSEIDVVQRNIDVMNEILIENQPGKEEEGMVTLMEEINATTRKMQERVTELIGRIQDSDMMVGLLGLNDTLNTLFIRYDRHMKNRLAVLQGGSEQSGESEQTTELVTMPTTSVNAVEYPSIEDEPPPYQLPSQPPSSQPLLEPLIDLSTDPTANTTAPATTGNNLASQLAALGLDQPPADTVIPTTTTTAATTAPDTFDEFDIFAQSRQAYSDTSGSTYDDNRVTMDANLADAVQGKPLQTTTDQTLASLDEWLNVTDLNLPPTDSNPAAVTKDESATSAEFDQFLAQRVTVGTSLPPARTKPQMQKAEEQNDELFAL